LVRSCQQLKYSAQSELPEKGVADNKNRYGSRDKFPELTRRKVSSGTEKSVPERFRPTDEYCATYIIIMENNRAQLAKKEGTKL